MENLTVVDCRPPGDFTVLIWSRGFFTALDVKISSLLKTSFITQAVEEPGVVTFRVEKQELDQIDEHHHGNGIMFTLCHGNRCWF